MLTHHPRPIIHPLRIQLTYVRISASLRSLTQNRPLISHVSSVLSVLAEAQQNAQDTTNTMYRRILFLAALFTLSSALIRFQCSQLVVQRLDPLVNPGQIPSAHVHQIVGGVR